MTAHNPPNNSTHQRRHSTLPSAILLKSKSPNPPNIVLVRVVPEAWRKFAPVAAKVTVVLRLLLGSQGADILEAVEGRRWDRCTFHVEEVVVTDDKDEGVYAWITANYLLDTIGKEEGEGEETYVALDSRRVSTQIVFERKFPKPDYRLIWAEGERSQVPFGVLGKTYMLYLGYRLMEMDSTEDFCSCLGGLHVEGVDYEMLVDEL
ncbi:Guanosine-diphosphatase [Marasmius crinis-equi]|uniref:guanosine-diphosphatase n=1 Tax=Marasmius crinis-equi TaxID=585013 RepID=A0ABR3EZ92_9AGAR